MQVTGTCTFVPTVEQSVSTTTVTTVTGADDEVTTVITVTEEVTTETVDSTTTAGVRKGSGSDGGRGIVVPTVGGVIGVGVASVLLLVTVLCALKQCRSRNGGSSYIT